MTKKVFIDGMSCGHCAARIEKSLSTLKGVSAVKVNLLGQFAEVETEEELTDKSVVAALDMAGYHLVNIG